MPSISDIISYGLREFEGFWKLGNIGITRIKNRVKTPYRVEKLADDVFTSKLKYGAVVTVKGKLTRYHGGFTLSPISNKNTKIPPITGQPPASEVNVVPQITGRETDCGIFTRSSPCASLPRAYFSAPHAGASLSWCAAQDWQYPLVCRDSRRSMACTIELFSARPQMFCTGSMDRMELSPPV